MKIKKVFMYSRSDKKFRILRILHQVGGKWTIEKARNGKWFSEKLSISLRKKWFWWVRSFWSYRLVFLGLEIHYKRSYGGVIQ
jgi:hypothetical protein